MLFSGKKIDVIHAAGLNAALVTRVISFFRNINWVMSTHAIYGINRKDHISGLIRWILRNTRKIICVCEGSREELSGIGIPNNKLISHTTWVNQEVFKPSGSLECKRRLNINTKPNVIFVGRLIEKKGVKRLIETASIMPECRFIVIGDGPLKDYVRRKAEKLDNLLFPGSVPNYLLPDYYNASEVTVMPSLYREPFGRVVAESLSCGVPVVLSQKAEIADFLFPPVAEKTSTEAEDIKNSIERTLITISRRDDVRKICREFAVNNYGENNLSTLLEGYGFYNKF